MVDKSSSAKESLSKRREAVLQQLPYKGAKDMIKVLYLLPCMC